MSKLLEELTDSDFSIHSIESLKQINDKNRVWFLAQGWSKDEFIEILSLGVEHFIVDNQKDLDVLLENLNKKILII